MEKLIETLKKGDTGMLATLFAVLLVEFVLRGFDEIEVHKAVSKAYATAEKAAAN